LFAEVDMEEEYLESVIALAKEDKKYARLPVLFRIYQK
jgi:hypothetical protein